MGRFLSLGILALLTIGPPTPGRIAVADGARAQALGSVTGTITTAARGVAPVRVTIDQQVCGTELPDEAIIVDDRGRLANAVVILTGVKRAAASEVMVINEKCRFIPRVQVVAPGATVKTGSKDAVLHTTTAQMDSGRPLFNVALPVPGITITKPMSATGTVRLSCNTHPWMRGWLLVTDEAAAITGADGRFTIDNVPPGTYELRVWHEALKGAPQRITVSGGKPAEVALLMK